MLTATSVSSPFACRCQTLGLPPGNLRLHESNGSMLGFFCPMTLYHTVKEGDIWTGFQGSAVMRAQGWTKTGSRSVKNLARTLGSIAEELAHMQDELHLRATTRHISYDARV